MEQSFNEILKLNFRRKVISLNWQYLLSWITMSSWIEWENMIHDKNIKWWKADIHRMNGKILFGQKTRNKTTIGITWKRHYWQYISEKKHEIHMEQYNVKC